jgi:type II secretory ATPase GspE/PulE/Tfp pilus assembly ATPase PilB-like protein
VPPLAPVPARTLAQLGLEPQDELRVQRVLQQALGLVLVVGPRQSGRSTTLAALLHALPAPVSVPSQGSGTSTSQAAPGVIGSTVLDPAPSPSALLRACATIASGRRVFSSLTLERAAHVFGHFRVRGLAPPALARDLLLVVAQQRVARLCAACRQADNSADLRSAMAQAANSWLENTAIQACAARPGGCAQCAGQGYSGTALAYELLPVDSGVRAMAEQGAIGLDMEQALFTEGRSLWEQGLRLVARGICSLAALRAAVREPC